MTEREAYLTLHRASGIEVGDKVRVLREPKSHECGWACEANGIGWRASVGKEYAVSHDGGDCGFGLKGYYLMFPFCVLERIEKGRPPIKIRVGYPDRESTTQKIVFLPGHIQVGCTKIDNDIVRKIAGRLVEKWRYFKTPPGGSTLWRTSGKTECFWHPEDKEWIPSDHPCPRTARDFEICKWKELTHEEAMKITGGVE